MITIERMGIGDLPEVLAIEQASFPTPFTEALFRADLKLEIAHPFVARRNAKVAGYIDFWHIASEIHLITIAIDPGQRKNGIGSSLMEFLIQYARKQEVERILLDVRPSNQAGLALYQKFGFNRLAVRKGYYQDNQEDALVMELRLTKSVGLQG